MAEYYVYRFLNKDNEVIYIGRTENLASRMSGHFSKNGHLPKECYEQVKRIDYLILNSKNDMKIKELYYIGKYMPEFNSKDKYEVSILINELNDAWILFDKPKFEIFLNEIDNIKFNISEKNFQIESLHKDLKIQCDKVNTLSSLLLEKDYELSLMTKRNLPLTELVIQNNAEDVSFNTAVKVLLENSKLTFVNLVENQLYYALYNVGGDIIGKILHKNWIWVENEFIVFSKDRNKEFTGLGSTENNKNYNVVELMNCNNWICAK